MSWQNSEMGMNIKNPEAHQLAREVAALTGENVTGAVTESLRERLERLRAEQREGTADVLLSTATTAIRTSRSLEPVVPPGLVTGTPRHPTVDTAGCSPSNQIRRCLPWMPSSVFPSS